MSGDFPDLYYSDLVGTYKATIDQEGYWYWPDCGCHGIYHNNCGNRATPIPKGSILYTKEYKPYLLVDDEENEQIKSNVIRWFNSYDVWPEELVQFNSHIYQNSDGWFFIDEIQSACRGPYECLQDAEEALHEYGKSL